MTATLLFVDAENDDPERTIAVPAPAIGDEPVPVRRPGAHLPLSARRTATQPPGSQSHMVGRGLTAARPGLHRVDQHIDPLMDGTWIAVCGAHVEPISDAYTGPWCLHCWPSAQPDDTPSQVLLERVLAGLRALDAEPPTQPIPAASPSWPTAEELR